MTSFGIFGILVRAVRKEIVVGGGVQADNVNFAEYIQKNFKLYELSNDLKLNTKASANFVRNEVSRKIPKLPSASRRSGWHACGFSPILLLCHR